jgi:hypothetical protein
LSLADYRSTPSPRKRIQRIRQRESKTAVNGFTLTAIGAIMSIMTDRQQKITFAEMGDMGVRGMSRTHQNEVAFGRVRTSNSRQDRPARSKMAPSRHVRLRIAAAQNRH